MAEPADFDVFIIGGGQAGPPLTRNLAGAGARVALAERKHLGGWSVNFGCTPTKAAIASARVTHLARRGAEYGVHIPVIDVDFATVIERARVRSGLKWRNSIDAWGAKSLLSNSVITSPGRRTLTSPRRC